VTEGLDAALAHKKPASPPRERARPSCATQRATAASSPSS
jgi:hypothetical protein